MVVPEKLAPFVIEQGPVGLYAVVYGPSAGIFLLESEYLAVEGQRKQQSFAAVPCEEHLLHSLGLDILAYILF